ncbi:MAG: ABC transporter ATP-binding protein [Candidatus Binatia bacterium]
MLRVSSLAKTYGGEVQAVRGIGFEVAEGEFYTLLGPSGCGKTTTLRCVAGLEKPDRGEISIGNDRVFSTQENIAVPGHKRDIGMVFQSYAIWPHMTVFDNVAFPLKHSKRKASRRELRDRVMKALSLVQLDSLEDRPAPFLSGGQQQRVALARALVYEPRVLLLDEPLSNLDAKLREEMRVELKQLVNRLHITSLYVTHDQAEALALSDRVAVMNQGSIIQEGPPREIYLQPRDTFTANFIGKANLFDGNVVNNAQAEGMGLVETSVGHLVCRLPDGAQKGDEVQIVIRPEGVDIFQGNPEGKNNVVQGEVFFVTFQGDSVEYQVRIDDHLCRIKSDSVTEIGKERKVLLYFPPGRCLVIPKDKRISTESNQGGSL